MFPLQVRDGNIQVDIDTLREYENEIKKKARKLSDEELEKRVKEGSKSKVSTRSTKTQSYLRDPYVVEYSKRRANGICQLCGEKAPFDDTNGDPYFEVHHIVWLSEGGEDTIENTVALCPNCHRKVHVVNDKSDVKKLKSISI